MTSDPAVPDLAARAAELGAQVDAATSKLMQSAASLTDEQARAASSLPGWSRGHLLTHIARNADSLRNLLIWARTGVETPQYKSNEAREQGVIAGAGRPSAQLVEDLGASAAAFTAEAARLGDSDWAAEVRGLRGPPHPAWYTLLRRLTEVEVHHVDLDAGYGPADWPAAFAAESLERVAGDFSKPDSPAALLVSADSGHTYRIGLAGSQPAVEITGPTAQLAAWLIGRSAGAGLTAVPAGPLPPLPAW